MMKDLELREEIGIQRRGHCAEILKQMPPLKNIIYCTALQQGHYRVYGQSGHVERECSVRLHCLRKK